MALDEADGTLPPLAWETPTMFFEDYTLLQAMPSDADELAVLATATARVGHFGDNLHLTSDRLRVVFWQTGAALFHCRYSFAQACESICQELEASAMPVLFHTHAFMFCWLQHPFHQAQPSTTMNLLHSPVHPSLSMRVDCWGRSRQVSWALSYRNPCSGGLEWFWPWRGGASPLIWRSSGLEETLFTFAQRCMVCS